MTILEQHIVKYNLLQQISAFCSQKKHLQQSKI